MSSAVQPFPVCTSVVQSLYRREKFQSNNRTLKPKLDHVSQVTLELPKPWAYVEHIKELSEIDNIMCILEECKRTKKLKTLTHAYLQICNAGLETHEIIGNYMVPLFMKCGNTILAQQLFHKLLNPNEYTWTSLIQEFVECEELDLALSLFNEMRVACVECSTYTMVAILKACTLLRNAERGLHVHAEIITGGFEMDLYVGNTLLDMYAKCGLLLEAHDVFDELLEPDVVSWTALISGYVEHGLGEEALSVLEQMQLACMPPNAISMFCGLKACSDTRNLVKGQQIHANIVKAGLESERRVGNTLMDMYLKCESYVEAHKVFKDLKSQDVVSWTVLISGCLDLDLSEEALSLYKQMRSESIDPDAVTFICCLKACSSLGDVDVALALHVELIEEGFERNTLVISTLIDAYARLGFFGEAEDTLYDLERRDIVTWNALLGGYAEHGLGGELLACMERMQLEGLPVNPVTIVCGLKGCANTGHIMKGLEIHNEIVKYGLETNSFICNSLLDLYMKCGLPIEAEISFDKMLVKNVVSWNILISGLVECGLAKEALQYFEEMHLDGVQANTITFVCSLKACSSAGEISQGHVLHSIILKVGFEMDTIIGNTLVDMYVKCGFLLEAKEVFRKLPFRDTVLWNTLISGYVDHGYGEEALNCAENMQSEGFTFDAITYVCMIKAAIILRSREKGNELHALIIKMGYENDSLIRSTLIDVYGKCGLLDEAQNVFDQLSIWDSVSWTSILSGYTEHNLTEEALNCINNLHLEGDFPSPFLFARILNVCSSAKAIDIGLEKHLDIVKLGFERDIHVANALVDMYGKLGLLEYAHLAFDEIVDKDASTWSALIAGYSDNGYGEETLICLEQMQLAGFSPDNVVFVCSLKASVKVGKKEKGKELHLEIVKHGFETDPYIENSLVDMYAKSGLLTEAHVVFDSLAIQDVVSWTALISGHTEHGHLDDALRHLEYMQQHGVAPNTITWNTVILGFSESEEDEKVLILFAQMQEQGILPDMATFASILKACGKTLSSRTAQKLHAQLGNDCAGIATVLIDMYGKCGNVIDAQKIFDVEPCPDLKTWNALLTGYARQEDSSIVFYLFQRMEEEGIRPNDITFLSILTFCSHAGLVAAGQNYFEAMHSEYGLIPTMKHQSCMIDLLGRAGQLDEAIAVMEKVLIQADFIAWSSVLGACQKWGNPEIGMQVFDVMTTSDVNASTAFSLMSNIHVGSQRFL